MCSFMAFRRYGPREASAQAENAGVMKSVGVVARSKATLRDDSTVPDHTNGGAVVVIGGAAALAGQHSRPPA